MIDMIRAGDELLTVIVTRDFHEPGIHFFTPVTALFPDWKDTWLVVARKKKGWQPRKTLSQKELSRILPVTSW